MCGLWINISQLYDLEGLLRDLVLLSTHVVAIDLSPISRAPVQ